MTWVAVGVGAVGLVGGALSADQQAKAAKNAAGAQGAAAAKQLGVDTATYNAAGVTTLPSRELGGLAQSREAYLLGLSPNLDISPDFAAPSIDPNTGQLTWSGPSSGYALGTPNGNPNGPNMNGIPNPNAGLPGPGGYSFATAPTVSGNGALNWGTTGAPGGTPGGYGSLNNPYDPSSFFLSPDYNFISTQGQRGIAAAGAAGGELNSGAQLRAAINYASGLASTDWNQAYTNSLNTKAQTFNMLQGAIGGGAIATGALNSAGQNFATGAGSAIAGGGNAAAAGYIGAGNAWSGAINGATNTIGSLGSMYLNNQLNPPSQFPNIPPGNYPMNQPYGSGTYTNPQGYTITTPS
ncbi:MAG: hypothetical protein ACREQ5_09590 [Candidatus Dormibacteria bacterium]